MEKYGFVYLWYDRKHKRFYIGCHWGTEDDGYVCSSSWMKTSYGHRSKDFKRRILKRVYTKKEMLEEEYNWLSKIKPQELKVRYYNLHNHHFNHWSANPVKHRTVSEKMIGNKNGLGKPCSPEKAQKISEAQKGKVMSAESREKMRFAKLGKKQSPEQVEKRIHNLRGKKRPEISTKVSETKLQRNAEKRALLGYVCSPETREKISQTKLARRNA